MKLINKLILYLAISLIKVYKYLLSPILANRCRFLPTCSEYAQEALLKHGVVKGSYLSMKRILSCHPFGKSGVDMVPELNHKERKCQN